jgi:UDP-3-O-[3-hydroxymyristoyl] glucosamine N-acyltransferase
VASARPRAARRIHRAQCRTDALMSTSAPADGHDGGHRATVGSCAQIGKNVHLSGGVVIGGALSPFRRTQRS